MNAITPPNAAPGEGLESILGQLLVMTDLTVAIAGSQWTPEHLATWKAAVTGMMEKISEDGFDTSAEREWINKFAVKIEQYMNVFNPRS